jgi:hypothetical protein
VLTVLMITDMTTGTGRFNLVHGVIGTVIAIAAAISIGTTGFLFEKFGHVTGFLTLAVAAVAASGLLWAALTETKPGGLNNRVIASSSRTDRGTKCGIDKLVRCGGAAYSAFAIFGGKMFQYRASNFSPSVAAIQKHLGAVEKELEKIGRIAGRQTSEAAVTASDQISAPRF